jgi:hypothetical protein
MDERTADVGSSTELAAYLEISKFAFHTLIPLGESLLVENLAGVVDQIPDSVTFHSTWFADLRAEHVHDRPASTCGARL